eukprot:1400923-Amphidinium_carterae.5
MSEVPIAHSLTHASLTSKSSLSRTAVAKRTPDVTRVWHRSNQRKKRVPTQRHSYLQQSALHPATLARYVSAVRSFRAWGRRHKLPLDDENSIDSFMAAYLNFLYFEGLGVSSGKMVVFGWLHLLALRGKSLPVLTKSKLALKGWGRIAPETVRDPIPFIVLAWMCEWMVKNGHQLLALLMAFQFDLYTRPSELLHVLARDVFPPVGRKRKLTGIASSYSLLLMPSSRGLAAKNRSSDGALSVGIGGRDFLNGVLAKLLKKVPPTGLLFGIKLSEYERIFKMCVGDLKLQALRLTPHCIRHGGPSHDIYHQHASLQQVQQRGRWLSLKSVFRYEKHGKIWVQLARLSTAQRKCCERAVASFAATLHLAVSGLPLKRV